MVDGALGRMFTGSVDRVVSGKKELVKMYIDWPGWVFDLKILENRVSWIIITLNHL